MAMDIILDLQKLEVPEPEALFGNSCTSSLVTACNGDTVCNCLGDDPARS
jgi:hypothetical protein